MLFLITLVLDPEISTGKGPFSHPKRRAMLFLIKTALDLANSAGQRPFSHPKLKALIWRFQPDMAQKDCFRSNIKFKVVLDHNVLRSGDFGRIVAFFKSRTRSKVVLDHDSLTRSLKLVEYRPANRARLFFATVIHLNSFTLKHR